MKILFAIFNTTVFLICFIVILFTDNPNAGIIAFTPLSFLVLVVYFGSEFLNLEISTKTISIKKRVNNLEKNHKELRQLITSLYKISLINFASKQNRYESKIFLKEYMKATHEIQKYLNDDEINSFSDLMVSLQTENV